ncbi:glycosyltransferase family 1 protein [Thermothielavioides terrestris NRRL 8126]|uniref:Glycosyltransferase family 1 protein n=1 Tax=Thermothielavioides terrestris (strain ATCC 38088 / NRRL 8126) TaxID=578455 RepID=G2R606_THETT|nr:glycosyltransferase family 1 protein [Thermothielavioides terrestris NRRL 8126]AEO68393.1 glycosyltransferase family 1 protein [Thermothielavioides terrestris NRRL 8126]
MSTPTGTPSAPLPLILILCTSSTAPGHVLPLCAIARHLVARGYAVTFVGGAHHRALIEAAGATFFPVDGSLTPEHGPLLPRWAAARARIPEGWPRMAHDFATFFVGQIEGQVRSTQAALEAVRRQARPAGREVLVVCETMWFGYLPWKWGKKDRPEGWAEGESMPRSLGVNVTPLMLDGVGMPPFPLGLTPVGDGGGGGPLAAAAVRERDALLREWLYKYVAKEAYDAFREKMKACGGTEVPDEWMVNLSVTAHDTTLQLCHPLLEYPRADLPEHVKFAGCLPPSKTVPPGFVFPAWWERDVVGNARLAADDPARRSVVVVSQGTLVRDYSMLLAPTIRALAGRKDVLLIALLGRQGAEVPPGILPSPEESVDVGNVRIADFIPYDSVLTYADVMVFNAGYGGFMHCVVNGVPVVAAGITEDKAEVSARVEWTGVGINLRTGRPSISAVAAAVDEILRNDKYRARARELAVEVAKGNPLEVVERELRALTQG